MLCEYVMMFLEAWVTWGCRERTPTSSQSESSSESGTSDQDQDVFGVIFEFEIYLNNEWRWFCDMLLYGERHNENNPVIVTNKDLLISETLIIGAKICQLNFIDIDQMLLDDVVRPLNEIPLIQYVQSCIHSYISVCFSTFTNIPILIVKVFIVYIYHNGQIFKLRIPLYVDY